MLRPLSLTLLARSHLTFWGPVDMGVEQISEEVRRDNEFYDRWFTEWDAYYSAYDGVTWL